LAKHELVFTVIRWPDAVTTQYLMRYSGHAAAGVGDARPIANAATDENAIMQA
jgi:hypothetical protein